MHVGGVNLSVFGRKYIIAFFLDFFKLLACATLSFMEPPTHPIGKRQRLIAGFVLVAYLGFAAWTFIFNDNVLRALNWFVPISLLMWFVLRKLRGNR